MSCKMGPRSCMYSPPGSWVRNARAGALNTSLTAMPILDCAGNPVVSRVGLDDALWYEDSMTGSRLP